MKNKLLKVALIGTVLVLFQMTVRGQSDSVLYSDLARTFMPQFQLGYVTHGTDDLSGGLMTQTSIEYRDVSNFILRVNYDVFNSNLNVKFPINDSTTFTGKTSFSEFIGGIGYRQAQKKHTATTYVQAGVRSYNFPVFTLDNNQVNFDFRRSTVGVMRYTLGYEYAITPKLFLTVEGLATHVFNKKDYWRENAWSYGATLGLSAPLF